MALDALPPPCLYSCFTFFFPWRGFIYQTILNMCQPAYTQILMNKLMTTLMFPPRLQNCRFVSKMCVVWLCECVYSCIPGSVLLRICSLLVCVCTAGSLCTYAHSLTHIKENKKTKPISLCHSNTWVKLLGLFGPIKDNDTRMQARPCREL